VTAVLEARVGEIEEVGDVEGGGDGVGTFAVEVGDAIEVDEGAGVIVVVAVGDSVEVGVGVEVMVEVGEGVVVSSRGRVWLMPKVAVTVAAIACGLLTTANAPMNESNRSMRDSTATNTLPGANLA
jgi:hypothetical protein